MANNFSRQKFLAIQYTMTCINISYSATTLNLNTNPAYEARTPLQRNIAYEDTTLDTREPGESQTEINQADPTYETIPLTSTRTHATT